MPVLAVVGVSACLWSWLPWLLSMALVHGLARGMLGEIDGSGGMGWMTMMKQMAWGMGWAWNGA